MTEVALTILSPQSLLTRSPPPLSFLSTLALNPNALEVIIMAPLLHIMMEDPITVHMVGVGNLASVRGRVQLDAVAVEVDALLVHLGAGEGLGAGAADAEMMLVGGEGIGGVAGEQKGVGVGEGVGESGGGE